MQPLVQKTPFLLMQFFLVNVNYINGTHPPKFFIF